MGFLEKLAHKKVLAQAQKAIEKSYKQGRLQFLIEDDNKVKYTDKQGDSQVFTIEECADHLWDKLNNEFGSTVTGATLGALGVMPDDIKNIILGLR